MVLGLDKDGLVTPHEVSVLVESGLPRRKGSRAFVDTSFSSWTEGSARSYCDAFAISIPAGVDIRHRLYAVATADGVKVHVPALALMRAFLRPWGKVLEHAFTATNIDRLAFLSFEGDFPVVKALRGPGQFDAGTDVRGEDRYVKWLFASKSGRACAQSVHTNALSGWLDLTLPKGDFRLAFHGVKVGNDLFASEVMVLSVEVPADDNASGQAEVVYLYRNEHVLADLPAVAGSPEISEDEWLALQDALPAESDAALVGLIVGRVKQGYWGKGEPGQVLAAGHLMQRWGEKGVLTKLFNRLAAIRRGVFAHDAARTRRLRAEPQQAGPGTVSTDRVEGVMKVFLDTEFSADGSGAAQLLSIGLCAEAGSEFYAEVEVTERPIGLGQFLVDEVLPQMGKGLGFVGSTLDIARHLATWFDSLGHSRLEVHYDFGLDYGFIEQLLSMVPGLPKAELVATHIGYLKEEPDGVRAAQQCWDHLVQTRCIGRHHALADALALKAQFEAVHGA